MIPFKLIKIKDKITTDRGDDYTAGYLLDYPYFENTIRW